MKTQPAEKTVKNAGSPHERTEHNHDAFGVVTVTKSQGSNVALFGSALKHNRYINIAIHRAKVDRHLNRDWTHAENLITSFSMSEAQWAQFVSSIGCGTGTPITLDMAPDRNVFPKQMPGLEQEPVRDTFENDFREEALKANQGILEAQSRIAEMTKPGAKPPSKKELEELKGLLRSAGEHFEANMAFLQRSFAKAMEKTVAAAKVEIETYVGDLAMRTGLEVLRKNGAPTLIEEANHQAIAEED